VQKGELSGEVRPRFGRGLINDLTVCTDEEFLRLAKMARIDQRVGTDSEHVPLFPRIIGRRYRFAAAGVTDQLGGVVEAPEAGEAVGNPDVPDGE